MTSTQLVARLTGRTDEEGHRTQDLAHGRTGDFATCRGRFFGATSRRDTDLSFKGRLDGVILRGSPKQAKRLLLPKKVIEETWLSEIVKTKFPFAR